MLVPEVEVAWINCCSFGWHVSLFLPHPSPEHRPEVRMCMGACRHKSPLSLSLSMATENFEYWGTGIAFPFLGLPPASFLGHPPLLPLPALPLLTPRAGAGLTLVIKTARGPVRMRRVGLQWSSLFTDNNPDVRLCCGRGSSGKAHRVMGHSLL